MFSYKRCRATAVFGDCEQGMLIHWMFGRKWDEMTDHFVDLQYTFPNGDCNKNKLYTMKQLKNVYENEDEYQHHFQEIQDMLLRRLRYHYRRTRKDEWRDYNARLNDGVRDFETMNKDKQS